MTCGVVALLAAAGGRAPAQAEIATVEECARMPTPTDEIACLRQALQQSQAASRGHDDEALPARQASDTGGEDAIRGAQAATPAPVTAPAPGAEQRRADLGAEQLARPAVKAAARAAEADDVRAVVIATETGPRDELTLRLDNGQLWRQTERPSVPLTLARNRQYPVEIARSGFGGYRMRFTGLGRQIVVKRME